MARVESLKKRQSCTIEELKKLRKMVDKQRKGCFKNKELAEMKRGNSKYWRLCIDTKVRYLFGSRQLNFLKKYLEASEPK